MNDEPLPMLFVSPDADDEPTVWLLREGREPEALLRRVDLPSAGREWLWEAITRAITDNDEFIAVPRELAKNIHALALSTAIRLGSTSFGHGEVAEFGRIVGVSDGT